MTTKQMQELENRSNFAIFLNKYGLKGKSEYDSLTKAEKVIVLSDYIKRSKSKKN